MSDSSDQQNSADTNDTRQPISNQTPGGPPPPPPPPPAGSGYGAPVVYGAAPAQSQSALQKVGVSLLTLLLVSSLGFNLYAVLLVYSTLNTGLPKSIYRAGDESKEIAIVPVNGMIDDTMAIFVRQAFDQLAVDPPHGVVLRINSGGGGVGASDRIWHQIREFQRSNPEVPVVASFGDVAASGGYYIAAPADEIFADPSCITGSIGVMAQAFTLEKMLDKIGVTPEVLVASQSPEKDVANNIFRSWDAQDRGKFQVILDHAYQQFFDVVWEGRQSHFSTHDELKAIADGGIYTADEAKNNKLIDDVGYLDDAIERVEALASIASGKSHVTVLSPRQPFNLATILGRQGTSGMGGAEALFEQWSSPATLRDGIVEMTSPRLFYHMGSGQ